MELWEQWYETAASVWKRSMDGSKEAFVDPFGLYRAWLKSVREAQEQLLSSTTKMLEPQEAWKRWFEATTEPWRRAITNGADPTGLITQWLGMMEEARTWLLAGSSIPADPFTFFKQWYDATSESWAKVVGDISGSDRFMQAASQFLESYASFVRASRRASEEYFGHLLQLSTRSDIARVAELVINVENKVDKLDEAFEDFEDSNAQSTATTNDAIAGMAGRLDSAEHGFEALPEVLQKLANVEKLEKRLDKLESKLDKLLFALEQIAARAAAPATKSSNVSRKTQASRNGSSRRREDQDQVEAKA